MDIHLNPDIINVKTSTVVRLDEHLVLKTPDGPIDLKVNISADLHEIPVEYHEVFLNMLTAKYLGTVSFGDNPFSKCLPYKKKKWYEFWKVKGLTV